ncbi:MAG TPA: antibiotic biosynthesis monooxygenase [Haliangiales bacterium]|nr:antibiotic biosynthesis monooxygenase [Haliangiales bacterium]
MVIVLIKTFLRDDADVPAYDALDARMGELVQTIPGFLSAKAYVADDGDRVSIIRFDSEAALLAWRNHPEHLEAQRQGREQFFRAYEIEVCAVTRAYGYPRREG